MSNFIKQLGNMPQIDGLAVGALALNAYVIFTQTRYSSFDQLLEPAPSHQIMVLQLSAVMAAVYLVDFIGDEEESRSRRSSSEGDGFMEFIAGFIDKNPIADGLSVLVVFMGFQTIQSNAAYGTSLFEFSPDLVTISMQLSALMILNFGIQFLGDMGS